MTVLFSLLLLLESSIASLPYISNVFGSHMVLQQNEPVELFGWSGQLVELSLIDANGVIVERHTAAPNATAHNRWKVLLAKRAANPHVLESFTIRVDSGGQTRATLHDVVFGEVWLCSGQSNMVFPLEFDYNATAEIAAADARAPRLRFMDLGTQWQNVVSAPAPVINLLSIPWTRATRAAVVQNGTNTWPGVSAVCYLFGRRLLEHFNVPIGLIDSSWGGTIIQAWMPSSSIANCPAPQRKRHVESGAHWASTAHILSAVNPANNYSALFNGMINPLVGMTMKGVVWYQGEQNTIMNDASGGPEIYACLFRSLIDGWRRSFKKSRLAFHYVQLPGSTDYYPYGDQLGFYPALRLAQADVLRNVSDVCMASAVDLGDWYSPYGSVHPRLKEPLAQRLFQCALAVSYRDKSVPFAGPTFVAATAKANVVTVTLSSALVASTTNSTTHETFCPVGDVQCNNCCGFIDVQLGSEGNWMPIEPINVTLSSNTLTIAAPPGLRPTAVRYLYADWPIAVFYSLDGLPLTPFVASID